MLGAELLSILEVLCGDPLYLDNTMVAQVLTHCPHHVANIRSMVSGRGSGCGVGGAVGVVWVVFTWRIVWSTIVQWNLSLWTPL